MQLSSKGLEAIKFFEGLRLEAYKDSAGIPTIGYGTIRINGRPVTMGMKITAEQAEQYLLADVENYVGAVNRAIKVPTTQNEFDALVVETYNIGIDAMQDSTFIKRHNAGNKVGCAEAMQWWNKVTVNGKKVTSKGLQNRRGMEAKIYLDAVYPK
ncbi:lysozyme [Citrobacter phage Michonne]|uniref:Endolysin n=1 Tax=Citrobacter phage Michonne TaxID=1675603 RepID=A0A0K1LPG6_9CAUD|nr:endolysin [Citrobacter phage Michonne]AKU44045.1 lysozyme [Citrobacter phage Michonne]AYR00838.1 endolysin [Citrobacter phage Maleficent]